DGATGGPPRPSRGAPPRKSCDRRTSRRLQSFGRELLLAWRPLWLFRIGQWRLALLWQIFNGTGFPNQFFNDSWVVGFWRADHVRHNVELGRRASRMAQAVLGSPGP